MSAYRPWTSALAAGVVFWAALMVQGLAGPASEGQRALAAAFALGFVGLLTWSRVAGSSGRGTEPSDPEARPPRTSNVLLFGCAAGLTLLLRETPLRAVAFALAVGCLRLRGLRGAAQALWVAAVATALAAWIPGTAATADALAALLGRVPGATTGAAYEPAPSALSLPAGVWALTFLLLRARQVGWRWPALGALGVLATLALQGDLTLFLSDRVGPYAGHGHAPPIFRSTEFVPYLLALCVALGWRGRPAQPTSDEDASWRALRPRTIAVTVGLGVLTFVLLDGRALQGRADRRVAFLNMGGIDWDRPTTERLGLYETGMFGLLPVYLERGGWTVSTIEEDELAELDSARTQVLALINCHRAWSEEEAADLDRFVRAGGSVLVLGDHTDVFGLMQGYNTLLPQWGIRFRFDSAYYAGRSWVGDLESKPSAIGLWNDPLALRVSVGASLETEAPARPVVVARYGFSDTGSYANEMGSYLGNYEYDPEERLGDLTVVAGAAVGRGQVIVFGDTSGFQNMTLRGTFQSTLIPLFDRLARAAYLPRSYAFEALAALLLVGLGVLAAWRRPHGLWRRVELASAGFVVAGAAAGLLPRLVSAPRVEASELDDAFLVDLAHFPNTGHYNANWNVPDPVATAACRAGLLPYDMTQWSAEAVREARAVALIGLRRALDGDDVDALVDAVEGGTLVLAACSAADRDAYDELFARFGVEIGAYSLGSLPSESRQKQRKPRFVDASPLLVAPESDHEPLYRYGDYLLAAAFPRGAGWLVVIGDTRFFSSRNVEGSWGWWPGNLELLHHLFTRYADGDETRTAPRFPAPQHPKDLD